MFFNNIGAVHLGNTNDTTLPKSINNIFDVNVSINGKLSLTEESCNSVRSPSSETHTKRSGQENSIPFFSLRLITCFITAHQLILSGATYPS
jgi:hypothetical protein